MHVWYEKILANYYLSYKLHYELLAIQTIKVVIIVKLCCMQSSAVYMAGSMVLLLLCLCEFQRIQLEYKHTLNKHISLTGYAACTRQ